MSIDQAGNNRVLVRFKMDITQMILPLNLIKSSLKLPSVIGHFNKTAPNGSLNTEQASLDGNKIIICSVHNQIRNIIRKELLLFGPTTFALPLTEEFLHYDSGILYQAATNIQKYSSF